MRTESIIAFIGGGNMAAALIGGLLRAGHPAQRLCVAELYPERADWLRREFNIRVVAQPSEAVSGAAAVVLAVKPQQMQEALSGITLAAGTTVISIAAGIALSSLKNWLGPQAHYIRTMPNTPALVSQGVTGLFASAGTPEAARALAESILTAAGKTVWLTQECDMDAVTALSGSGPAYYFLMTEVLREAGIKLGLAPDTAALLARQTFIGAARMAETSPLEMTTLRANVTSKGGTTEAAVRHLENGGIRTLFADALSAAHQRGRELGELMNGSR